VKFVGSPTERTTALTDVLVAIVAAAASVFLLARGAGHPFKADIWSAAFGLIALSAALGALSHGIVLTDRIQSRIWRVINLSLGAAVSLFAAGVVYDLLGLAAARRLLPLMLAAGGVFFLITCRYPQIFFVFILYEAAALLFALGAYGWLTWRGSCPGAAWMTAGVSLSLAAAAIQASPRIMVNIIWPFDHNGVFHLVQAAGLLLLLRGLASS